MDIKSLMNESGGQSQAQQSRPQPGSRTVSEVYGAHASPPLAQHQFRRPSIASFPAQPPPLDTRSSSYQHPPPAQQYSTPVRTPQAQTPGQYPFPAQYQSPVQGHQRGPDRYPSSTPTARSASHSYVGPLDQRSPSTFAPPPPAPSASHPHASATPPSSHLQSPHAVRRSPGANGPSHHAHVHPQHPSQPNTPLGPPPIQRPFITTPQAPNPYPPHQRSFSTTSGHGPRSIASDSPGPPISNVNQLIESPAGHAPPVTQVKRRSTEQVQQMERNRSISVSPKTQVSRRHPSGDTRNNSHDVWSNAPLRAQSRTESEVRSGLPDNPSHVPPPYPQPPLSRSSTGHYSQGAPSPLSQAHSLDQQRTQSIEQYRPPPMSTPHSVAMKGPPDGASLSIKHEEPKVSLLQQPVSSSVVPTSSPTKPTQDSMAALAVPLKRRADQYLEPEAKKPRTRYEQPPPWARLHPSNPRYEEQIRRYPQLKDMPLHDPRAVKRGRSQQPSVPAQHVPSQPQSTPRQANGQLPVDDFAKTKHNVSRLLGMPWELSLTDKEPVNSLVDQVCEFLYTEMLLRPELGAGDPRNGSLEIEAKIGVLEERDSRGRRISLPVMNPVVLNPDFSRRSIQFQSIMNEEQHKSYNLYFNDLVRQSLSKPSRSPIHYQHRYERDTFAPLSDYGRTQLPTCAHDELRRRPNEVKKLRTTFDNNPKMADRSKPRPVLAQIIKIRLADLDIHCPSYDFDVRLSMNIEIDFHGRDDVDPAHLVEEQQRDVDSPDRYKNRLSYKHLLYSIDLTQVTSDPQGTRDKKHELEVEVDAKVLRDQAQRVREGKENCYAEVVQGLVNNVMLLARHRVMPAP